jgi:hypothetical protein
MGTNGQVPNYPKSVVELVALLAWLLIAVAGVLEDWGKTLRLTTVVAVVGVVTGRIPVGAWLTSLPWESLRDTAEHRPAIAVVAGLSVVATATAGIVVRRRKKSAMASRPIVDGQGPERTSDQADTG